MGELVRLAKEALRQQKALDPVPTIQPGDRITWDRAGSVQTGLVDFVHVDVDGTAWAFVTLRETWAAVNCKFVKAVTV
jgi:hypothetical protein